MIALQFAVPFAALVLAPAGLWVAGATVRTIGAVLATAVLLAASLRLEAGSAAALAIAPFCAACVWASRRTARVPCLYLAGGGLALALSRTDWEIPAFPPSLLLLAAVHFFYGGFAASLFTACAGKALGAKAYTPWFTVPAMVILGAPVALVAGTAVSRYLEAAVSLMQALALIAVAAWALVANIGSRRPLRTLALSIAAACTVIGMAASAIFAASRFGNLYWLPVPELGALHAVAMGAGFSLIGLLAWLEPRPDPAQLDHTRSGSSSRVPS